MARPSYVKFDSDQSNTFRVAGMGGRGARLKACRPVSPANALAARGESPVTQKMGTATDFRSPSLLETKHFDERKSDGSPHFYPDPLLPRAAS